MPTNTMKSIKKPQFSGAGEVSDTGFDVEEAGDSAPPDKAVLISVGRPVRQFDRYLSMDAFNTKSLPNEMVSALRFFEHGRKEKPPLDWGEVREEL